MRRRDALSLVTLLPLGSRSLARTTQGVPIKIDPTPKSAISPRLYMQFMEPLGATDSSVEAAWDVNTDNWRDDFVATVRDLAPGAIRWGGIFTSYWKWREGVGPANKRTPMINYLWGGRESNRIGVDEVLAFCGAVGAEPLRLGSSVLRSSTAGVAAVAALLARTPRWR